MDTKHLHPNEVADVLGTVVKVALVQAAGALDALRTARQALYDGDVDKATLVIGNYLTTVDNPNGVLVDLDTAIYNALPRGGEQVSY